MQMVCGDAQAGAALGPSSDTAAGGSERRRPAQQMLAEIAEQEAMGADPAGRFEHGEGAVREVGRGGGGDQSGQRGTESLSARAKAA